MLGVNVSVLEGGCPPRNSTLYGSIKRVRAREHLAHGFSKPINLHVVLEGFAASFKILEDGRRQITGLYFPGDFCDPGWLHESLSFQTIVSLTPMRTISLPTEVVEMQVQHDVGLLNVLAREANGIRERQAEWAFNLGRKTAFERLAHFFCELFARLSAVGLTRNDGCDMPLTQGEIADFTGLTPVHVNRTLQDLRAQNLLSLRSRQLRIPDRDRLARAGLFDGRYLRFTAGDRVRNHVGVARQPSLATLNFGA